MSKVTHRAYVSNRTHLLSLPRSGLVMSLCSAGGNVQTIAMTIVMLTTILSLGCMDVTTQRDLVRDGPGAATSSAAKTFSVGEKASLGNLDMTVNGVRVSDGKDTSIWVPFPKQGSIYLFINVTLENVGDESENVSSRMQANLIDSSGRTQEWGLFPAARGSVDGILEPGKERQGELVWEVTEDAAGRKMVFDKTVFAIGDAANYWERNAGGLLSSKN